MSTAVWNLYSKSELDFSIHSYEQKSENRPRQNDKEHLLYCAFLDFEHCIYALRVVLVVSLETL